MREQMAGSHFFGYSFIMQFETYDVLLDRDVEVNLSLLKQLHQQRGGEWFADRTRLKQCICSHRQWMFEAGHTEAFGIFLSIVPDSNCHARHLEPLHF